MTSIAAIVFAVSIIFVSGSLSTWHLLRKREARALHPPDTVIRCDEPLFAGRFNSDQRHFLDYHRKEIFLKSTL